MVYTITLWCGCRISVSGGPDERVGRTRIVEARGAACPDRRHIVAARLRLWEMLPEAQFRDPALGSLEDYP